MMATDKSSKRGSLWAKTAGDRGWKVPRLPRGTICSGLRAAWDHISALVFPHLFSKNTTCLNEEYNCRWSRMSTRVDKCTFVCRGSLAWALFEHFPKTEVREGGGGTRNDPSVGRVGVHIRQARWQRRLRQMNQPSRCERSVKEMFTFIHPSSSVARRATRLSPQNPTLDTITPHAHTHTLASIHTRETDRRQSHIHALCNIHTHFHSHTHYHGRGELATSCWHFHRH